MREQRRRDRPGQEHRRVAAGDQHGAAEVFLHQRAEHEAEDHRRRLEVVLHQPVADDAEDRGHRHVERRVVDRVDADAAEDHDHREQVAVRHAQQAHPHADQRQVDDDQHQVAEPHRGDHAPEQLGLLGHDLRARHDAVDGHGADHQRHHRVRRDAEREQRNERGLRGRVVGAFRRRDAFDGAAAEPLADAWTPSSRACRRRTTR